MIDLFKLIQFIQKDLICMLPKLLFYYFNFICL